MIRFSNPDPHTNIIKVTRILPDNTEESIGQLYPDFVEGSDSVVYFSVNQDGEEMVPPTSDFQAIESQFENTVRQKADAATMQNQDDLIEEYCKRKSSIRTIRLLKSKIPSKQIIR